MNLMYLKALLLLCLCSQSLFAAPEFVHCYDFGCKSQQSISFSPNNWQRIQNIFNENSFNAFEEKQAIRQAIALMEQFSGEIVGTSNDKAGNYPGYDIDKQHDCIDESTNTFQYLKALEDHNLLRWHRVEPKKRRIVWFISHWTAVISENDSGQQFAVDSWYRDNGQPPYLQKLEDWEDKEDFPAKYNPD